MRPLTLLVVLAAATPARADCPGATARLEQSLAAREFVDVHYLALAFAAICPEAPDVARWRLLDAVALVRLDEHQRALAALAALTLGPDPRLAARAAVLLSWARLQAGEPAGADALAPVDRARVLALAAVGDADAFDRAATGLDPTLRARALAQHRRYLGARQRSPALAGTLSAVIPGLGQLYAGSWEGALVALSINAVLVGATVELARHDLWLSAAATGVAGSIFYVGNILNAADLAARRNETAQQPARDALERALVPEAYSGAR